MYRATVKVPGSCGELVQGKIGKNNFLVTCPIDRFSRCSIKLSSTYRDYKVNIENSEKTIKAVKAALKYYGREKLGARIQIESNLIRGKGMASSSADITGVIGALLVALDLEIDLNLIKKLALKIEPTDGIFLSGINIFDHISGQLEEKLADDLKLDILMFTEKGIVNTCQFNKKYNLNKLKANKEPLVKKALHLVKRGFKENNKKKIARGATLSCKAHQKIIYRPYIDDLIEFIKNYDYIYGINIAHSGKLLGILINSEINEVKPVIKAVEMRYNELNFIDRHSIISGGIIIEG
ncbi:MAG: hypothetical protein ACOCQ5_00385 [Halanaerobiales bacterium]